MFDDILVLKTLTAKFQLTGMIGYFQIHKLKEGGVGIKIKGIYFYQGNLENKNSDEEGGEMLDISLYVFFI